MSEEEAKADTESIFNSIKEYAERHKRAFTIGFFDGPQKKDMVVAVPGQSGEVQIRSAVEKPIMIVVMDAELAHRITAQLGWASYEALNVHSQYTRDDTDEEQ